MNQGKFGEGLLNKILLPDLLEITIANHVKSNANHRNRLLYKKSDILEFIIKKIPDT